MVAERFSHISWDGEWLGQVFCLDVVLKDSKGPRASQGNVDTIPERPIVIGIGLKGWENFISYSKYIWSGGSLYPLYLPQWLVPIGLLVHAGEQLAGYMHGWIDSWIVGCVVSSSNSD